MKRAKVQAKTLQYAGRLRRATAAMLRWEARMNHELQGTTPWIDGNGTFRYWDFQRNTVKMWGRGAGARK